MESKLSLMRLVHDDLKEAIRRLGKTTTYTQDRRNDNLLIFNNYVQRFIEQASIGTLL